MQKWLNVRTKENEERAILDTPAFAPHHREAGANEGGIDFAQIKLPVRDLTKMRAFYELVLGISAETLRRSAQTSAQSCRFQLHAGSFILTEQAEKSDDSSDPAGHSTRQIVFSAGGEEGVDALFQKLKGVPECAVRQIPHYANDNRYEMIVDDPEGNELIFQD